MQDQVQRIRFLKLLYTSQKLRYSAIHSFLLFLTCNNQYNMLKNGTELYGSEIDVMLM